MSMVQNIIYVEVKDFKIQFDVPSFYSNEYDVFSFFVQDIQDDLC